MKEMLRGLVRENYDDVKFQSVNNKRPTKSNNHTDNPQKIQFMFQPMIEYTYCGYKLL